MAKKIKDTDYLVISARVKAMETGLLTRERMEQILEAKTDEEAAKILQECGYPELDAADPEAMDAALSAAREETLTDVMDGAPEPRYIELFKLKYDYHNVKALLKAEAMGTSADRMLMDMGRVPAAVLKEAVRTGELDELPPMLASAVAEAREILDTTRDPQLSDIALDRWTYADMAGGAGGRHQQRFSLGLRGRPDRRGQPSGPGADDPHGQEPGVPAGCADRGGRDPHGRHSDPQRQPRQRYGRGLRTYALRRSGGGRGRGPAGRPPDEF